MNKHDGEDQFTAFDYGFDAFYDGIEYEKNPYPIDSGDWSEWNEGYNEAIEHSQN